MSSTEKESKSVPVMIPTWEMPPSCRRETGGGAGRGKCTGLCTSLIPCHLEQFNTNKTTERVTKVSEKQQFGTHASKFNASNPGEHLKTHHEIEHNRFTEARKGRKDVVKSSKTPVCVISQVRL